MSVVRFQDCEVELRPDETVLSGLERAGRKIPNSCRAGVCQSCLLQAVEGEPPAQSQRGLKPALALQGYFLACQCKPQGDLAVALPSSVIPSYSTKVLERECAADDVVVLRLSVPSEFACRPGQYVHLEIDGLVRSYSVASLPERDGHIELHVRRVPGGRVSNWLHDAAEVGTECILRGPLGSCFYVPDEAREFPILLAGTSTGLAPLIGVARDALAQGHRGPLTLLHGARERAGLYFAEELRKLADTYDNFHYLQLAHEDGEAGNIEAALKQHFRKHEAGKTRVFLCGAPDLVKRMKTQVFLLGAASSNIHSDPFVMAPPAIAA
jgi:Flavodoxin reductases (ferredoxin-NADPH reductases) family 1